MCNKIYSYFYKMMKILCVICFVFIPMYILDRNQWSTEMFSIYSIVTNQKYVYDYTVTIMFVILLVLLSLILLTILDIIFTYQNKNTNTMSLITSFLLFSVGIFAFFTSIVAPYTYRGYTSYSFGWIHLVLSVIFFGIDILLYQKHNSIHSKNI